MTLVRTSVDAWVSEDVPSANYSQSVKLHMRGDTDFRKFSYIFFNRPFPATHASVSAATLKVNLAGAWAGSQQIIVKRITQSWREGGGGGINWNNKPTVADNINEGLSDVITDGTDRTEVEIALADMMNDVAGGSGWFGVRISCLTPSTRTVYSSDHPNTALRPTLDVEWGEIPDAPDNLTPSGGRAISVAKPVLEWDFGEKGAEKPEQAQSSSQVEISTTSSFASVEYQSNKQPNVDSRWDLGTAIPPYVGVPSDETRYWRVRAWDGNDLMSEFSDAQSFSRRSKASLVIDNPPASPNNFVEELTPPIAWTFTGRTQEAFALTLYEIHRDGDVEVHRVAKTISSDTSYTLPFATKLPSSSNDDKKPRPLIRTGFTYRVRVRVYDTLDRQSIAGDPDYVLAERVFTYQRSGTPSAVTNLTATTTGPGVTLTFERATRPDAFALKVNDVEVYAGIDPDDVFVSGTTYQMDYWGAIPDTLTLYEVEAMVRSSPGTPMKHSGGNDTEAVATKVKGIWLVDPDDSRNVRIDGQQPADLAIRETGTTYDVPGSQVPVRIVDSLGGYSGDVSGGILTAPSRDDFLELKYRQKPLRLILSDLNIPVMIEEASAAPTPSPGTRIYDCSFSCFQIDEFFEIGRAPAGIVTEPPPDEPPPTVTDDSALLGEAQTGAMVPGT